MRWPKVRQFLVESRLRAAFLLASDSLRRESFTLGWGTKDRELEKMKLDDLWDLYQRIVDALERDEVRLNRFGIPKSVGF